ncbi:uncharacterized protein I206_106542 [Kwoniella pini CBS 10737]|uniref:C-CAP/cofactor C-like domain-containing protein n=1 Tax=Kwoniella pini CBS 10737 TaxID=1296096 RepID=A0A1B9HS87_9TREE|nr:uncharacterized protein I206_07930 [Kwoniella pini CBS 10737]OCF46145.1 hypothetical protein I206_07930 [Kwoniella pini CBS 10737]
MSNNNNNNISISQSNEFHIYFTKQKEEIENLMIIQKQLSNLNEINLKIKSLRNEFNKILNLIPIYDRVKYDKQLNELENKNSSIIRIKEKEKSKPKLKFSFNKSNLNSNSTSNSTTIKSNSIILPIFKNFEKNSNNEIINDNLIKIENNLNLNSNLNSIYEISNLSNKLIKLSSNEIKELSLLNLKNCIIDLTFSSSSSSLNNNNDNENENEIKLNALYCKSIENCLLISSFSSMIKGSCLLDKIKNSILILNCQQFRIHSSNNNIILLNVNSLPIIENSNKIKFGSFPFNLFNQKSKFTLNDKFINQNHTKVQDFNWPLPIPSPNWNSISNSESQSIISLEILNEIKELEQDDDVKINQILVNILPPNN